jgi:PAS domain S-box-containing protein
VYDDCLVLRANGLARTLLPSVLLAAVSLVCAPNIRALDPSLDVSQYAHTAWKIRDGFAKGTINDIAQTFDGYLWLGTDFGLLRFDGVRAVPWQPPADQPLPSSNIYGLLAARDGTLWIGTANGLAAWKDGRLTPYPELAGQYVDRIVEDREGVVWAGSIGIPHGRICAIRIGSAQCYGEDGSLGTGVFGLYEDSKGNLWAGVENGLWRWKPGPPHFYPMPGEGDSLKTFAEDHGTLLISTRAGIERFADGKTEPYPLAGIPPERRVYTLHRDRDGGLWIGEAEEGIAHVHEGRTDVFAQPSGLSGNWVKRLFEDREGNIWAVTEGGLDRFRGFAVVTVSASQGLASNVATAVLASRDESVWLGTYGGLDRWSHGQITAFGKHAGKLDGQNPNSLFEDRQGQVWVSTNREFGYLKDDGFTPAPAVPGGVVHGITEDAQGNLWIANQELGLLRLRPGDKVQTIPWGALGHKDPATALVADPSRGGVWIGFFNGGIGYFGDGKIQASYTAADGLGAGRVNDLRAEADGTLWAATDGGLSRLKDGRVATLSGKNGLPCDAVHWSLEDDAHSVWLSMPCGLVRVARSELDAWAAAADKDKNMNRTVQSTVFDSSDGEMSWAIASGYSPRAARSADGKLWLTSPDGAGVIDPRHIPFNNIPPPVHVEQVIADRKPYDVAGDANGRMRLPARVHDLEIDYTALSLVAPEKNLFRYKLEGVDRDWQGVGNRRQAYYTNLPPGNYRFRVAACNNSGVWNETGDSLEFEIPPAWYQSLWFRFLCALALCTLLWGLHRLRVQQLQEQEAKFREAVESMPALAFISESGGNRSFVNHGWLEYTGMTLEQAIGMGWQQAVHPDDLKRVLERWRATVSGDQMFEYETRMRRGSDGAYRWFQMRARPLRDKRGKVVKWCAVATDIEDRKHAEQLQADLAHVNRITTLGELAASISHELKQPIGAAMATASAGLNWLRRDVPDLKEVSESLENIVGDGKRATEIIDRLRALYKKTPPNREPLAANDVIGEMVVLLRGEATRNAVSIRTDLAEHLPNVIADRVQIQQVLMNLMLNSIEAMNDTGGVLTVRSELRADGQVQISVIDTGPGLPLSKTDRIFDAFFTTKAQGSGMGLAVCRSIVESHGGRIWANGNGGIGATFHFVLPTASTDEPTSRT